VKHRNTLRALLLLVIVASLASAVYAEAAPAGAGVTVASATTHTQTRTRDCFGSLAGCGYPSRSAHNVGVGNCSHLRALNRSHPPKGTRFDGANLLEVTRAHATVKNLRFPSNVRIMVIANNATINHVCVMTNGGGHAGSTALMVRGGTTGTKVENSTLGGANRGGQSSEQAITNDSNAARTSAYNDELINCGECVHGAWKLTHSYVDANASIRGEHYEDWYFSDGTISANHDVFINPHEQTAEIFGDTHGGSGGPADNHVTITNSLLAGGGFMIYTDASSSSVGSSSTHITGNRFARCTGRTVYNRGTGGESCSGGVDAFGIWPRGGYFGVMYPNGAYCSAKRHTWKNNSWDNNRSRVHC
jgi:hypothetical protein